MNFDGRSAIRFLTIILLGTVLFAVLILGDGRPTAAVSRPKERLKAYQWFGGLGYPDVKEAPFVRVATGEWSRRGSDPPKNSYLFGFLIEEKEVKFTVLALNLDIRAFERTPTGVPDHERVDYETIEIAEFASTWLKELGDLEKSDVEGDHWRRFGERLSERAELFVLAWASWRKGHENISKALFNQAAAMREGREDDQNGVRRLRQRVASDIAHAEMWRAVLDIGNASVPREQLLTRFERFSKNFPESEHAPRAKETGATLKKMVGEDKEHAERRKNGKSFEKMSQEEQIAELVFQLRDQNGQQWSQPGACDIFMTPDGTEDSPAHRLLKIGYDAVPQLIEALDDERFSRSVGYHRDFYFSHNVLTVGDCAQAILSHIASRPFYQRTYTNGYMAKDRETAKVKKEVEAWYRELKQKGEKQMLIDAVEKGDETSVYMAAQLVEKYPDVALSALLTGLKKAEGDWIRWNLIKLAGSVSGDGPVPFLLKELNSGASLEDRLVAARALNDRERPEGMAAMIETWNGWDPEKDLGAREMSGVAGFLAHCGKPEAVAALARSFDHHPINTRLAIVSAFGSSESYGALHTGDNGDLSPGKAPVSHERKEHFRAVVDLLVAALDDTDLRDGYSGTWNDKSFADPRICDIAGHILNQIDKEKFPFDLEATLDLRDRDRLALKNAWRKEKKLPPLPEPKVKEIKPAPDESLLPMLDRFERAETDREQKAAETEIAKLGLAALSGTIERERSLPADTPGRKALNRLARKLASTVAEVEYVDKSLKPNKVFASKVDALRGKPLDAKRIAEAVVELVKDFPEPVQGLRVLVFRAGDGTGTKLQFDLLDGRRRSLGKFGSAKIISVGDAAENEPDHWAYSKSVRVGKEWLHGSSGVGSGATDVAEIEEMFRHASTAPTDQPVEIRLEVIGMWSG